MVEYGESQQHEAAESRLFEQMEHELEMSASNQLDVVGMQPHSREYLEYEMNCKRSSRKFHMIEGAPMDYTDGIQFSGKP